LVIFKALDKPNHYKYNIINFKLFVRPRRLHWKRDCQIARGCIITSYCKRRYIISKKKAPPILDRLKKITSNKDNEHKKDIFDTFQKWPQSFYSFVVDFISFHPDNLNIRVVEQINPVYSTNNSVTSMEEKAISHLDCDEYYDAYDKFKEIDESQNRFNNKINKYLENHKKQLTRIIKL
jgi:hypothetical protein